MPIRQAAGGTISNLRVAGFYTFHPVIGIIAVRSRNEDRWTAEQPGIVCSARCFFARKFEVTVGGGQYACETP